MKINKDMLFHAVIAPIPRLLAKIPLQVLGFFMTVIAYRYRDTDLADLPRWIRPWANPEDWTGGWRGMKPGDNCIPEDLRDEFSGFWGFYRYHGLRNRAYGTRTWPFFSLKLVGGQIHYQTNNDKLYSYSDWWLYKNNYATPGAAYWYFAWQEGRIGFKYIRYFDFRGETRFYQCKCGWRINPNDARNGYNPKSHRWNYGTTVTLQPIQLGRAGQDYD